jgi:cell division protein ZapA
MSTTEHLTLTLLGREYRVACRPEDKDQLLACARYAEQKMAAIRDDGKVLGQDRIAVMAALQLAQEVMTARNADGMAVGELRRRLADLHKTVDDMLAAQGNLFS